MNGVSYFRLIGDLKNKRVLVFLPGIGTFKENYIRHLQSFTSYYEFIYAIDLPEQGSKGQWSIGEMVENLAIVIKAEILPAYQCIHLAGHSAGSIAVLSYMFNYNKRAEACISKNMVHSFSADEAIAEAKKHGFLSPPIGTELIEKLFLYATPTSFVSYSSIKKRIVSALGNQSLFKFVLNAFVNYPMLVMKKFTSDRTINFLLDKQGRAQFYNLVLSDHHRFFHYVEGYYTIFDLYKEAKARTRKEIDKTLQQFDTVLQYGSDDKLIKFFLRKKEKLRDYYQISSKIRLIEHQSLGHLLLEGKGFVVNMNSQVLTNKKVNSTTIKYIEY
jgi:pimeloyl-ACP methyl ester carboxylesterase